MTSTVSLPAWATAILNGIPKRGDGMNRGLFRAAMALRQCHHTEAEIESALISATAGEPLQPGEIARAVKRSKDYMTSNAGFTRRSVPKWPAVDADARQRVIDEAEGYGAADLFSDSPWRFDDNDPATETVIDRLFPGDPLLCVGAALNDAHTRKREAWRGRLAQMQFIVPSAMTKLMGKNQEGRDSERCLDNTGERCYLVVEQDSGTPDEQAAILRRLATMAPLVLACRSGGKSLHAWFKCAGASAERQRQFFTSAVRLGADPATWTRCQFVRMPDGWRSEKEERQHILFFAPEVCS